MPWSAIAVLIVLCCSVWLSSPSRAWWQPDVGLDVTALSVESSVSHGRSALYASAPSTGTGGGRRRVSFWHDLPLYPRSIDNAAVPRGAGQGRGAPLPRVINFVCEIPAGDRAKLEVQKSLPDNPIVQDRTKSGEERFYPWPSLVNYGAAPRTYEHPRLADHVTGLGGDGDPVDVVELVTLGGEADAGRDGPCTPGDVYPVRLLGALAMVEGGAETDWKLIAVRVGGRVERGMLAQDLAAALPVVAVTPPAASGTLATADAGSLAASIEAMRRREAADTAYDDGTLGPGALRPPPATDASPREWRAWAAGRVRDLGLWLRDYKRKADGSGVNSFAWDGAPTGSEAAARVVAGVHAHWCALLHESAGKSGSEWGLPEGSARRLLAAECASWTPSDEEV